MLCSNSEEVHDRLFWIIIFWAHSGVPLFWTERIRRKKNTMKDKTATRGTTYCWLTKKHASIQHQSRLFPTLGCSLCHLVLTIFCSLTAISILFFFYHIYLPLSHERSLSIYAKIWRETHFSFITVLVVLPFVALCFFLSFSCPWPFYTDRYLDR